MFTGVKGKYELSPTDCDPIDLITIIRRHRRVMKKYFLGLTALFCIVFLPWSISAEFQNDPNGFGGMYWGEPLGQIQPDMHAKFYKYGPDNDPVYFVQVRNASGELYLNGRITAMTSFHNDRLIGILIPLIGRAGYGADQSYNYLYAHYRQLFGVPNKVTDSEAVWSGPYTVLILSKAKDGPVVFLMSAHAAHQYEASHKV